jgi:hypothetical protein
VSALLLELAPTLAGSDLVALLRRTATPLGHANVYGAGRIDPVAAAASLGRGRP